MRKRLRARSRYTLAALCSVVFIGGCNVFGPEVRCGPLSTAECEQKAQEVQRNLSLEFPNRRVVYIEFVNDDAFAIVRLDDGTEIGIGEGLLDDMTAAQPPHTGFVSSWVSPLAPTLHVCVERHSNCGA